MDFGEKMAAVRREHDWTQPEAAERIGIEQSYLSKLENGKSMPSAEVYDRLLEAYGLDERDLLPALSPRAQARLKSIPRVAAHLEHVANGQRRTRRGWLLAALLLGGLGAFLVAGADQNLFGGDRVFEYRSAGVVLPGESVDVFRNWRDVTRDRAAFEAKEKEMYDRLDEQTLLTEDYRGSQFNAPVDGGSRTWVLGDTVHTVSKTNRVATALGIALLVMGLLALYLARTWK